MDLRELLSLPGVDEQYIARSVVGFMALHGGSQDRGTDIIARRAAELAGASLYAIVQPPTLRVHLTSRLHDPEQSAALRQFLDHVKIAISIHGFGRDSFSLWHEPGRGLNVEAYGPAKRGSQRGPLTGIIIGGLNDVLLHSARDLFAARLPDFHVADERVRLGFHPRNPVNLPAAHGIQIELPPGLRGIGPYGEQPVPTDDGTVTDLVTALVDLAALATTVLDTQVPSEL
jgi:phage replication-related protein YjqB (UPF0714/DUF867 family)